MGLVMSANEAGKGETKAERVARARNEYLTITHAIDDLETAYANARTAMRDFKKAANAVWKSADERYLDAEAEE